MRGGRGEGGEHNGREGDDGGRRGREGKRDKRGDYRQVRHGLRQTFQIRSTDILLVTFHICSSVEVITTLLPSLARPIRIHISVPICTTY